jgi:diguanylate cyclase (GGDEF)-like protein/PAS domain S-box-containing protein
VLDASGAVRARNSAASRLLGICADELLGSRPPFAGNLLGDGTPITAANSPALRVLRTGRPERDVVVRMGERWVSVNYQPLLDPDGEPNGLVWSFHDVTDRRRALERLRDSEVRSAAVIATSLDCVVVADERGRVVEFNPAAESTFGWTREEAVGREIDSLIVPERLRQRHRSSFSRAVAGGGSGSTRMETVACRRDGSELPVEVTITSVLLGDGRLFTAFVRDITERKRAEERVNQLAFRDGLTGLPNRALLEGHLRKLVASRRREHGCAAAIFLDLDNFKVVNDSLGHAAGDEVLCMVANRLLGATRESDMLARLGGDEFVLVAGDVDPARARESVEAVAEKLHAALSEPFELGGAEFEVTASVGASIFPRDADDAQGMMRNADAAMYQSKAAGRGRSAFYEAGSDDPRQRLSGTMQLRRAVERDELVLHYQPLFSVAGGAVTGAEALVRWRHPERGLLGPGEFIGLAEDTGLIRALGDWVIDAACRQAAAWRAEGLDVPVALNVSPRQLRGAGPAATLAAALARYGLPADSITVEITETAVTSGDAEAAAALQGLSALGVRIAIDDFGAGHSSLGRLAALRVHELKIDRAFLALVPGEKRATAIFKAIMDLGSALGIVTVAEGVETAEQLAFLCERGCDRAQGFHLARPMAAEAATAFLRAHRR